eukprot:scaffold638_cov84-Isochrysis_galbana.AAC.2
MADAGAAERARVARALVRAAGRRIDGQAPTGRVGHLFPSEVHRAARGLKRHQSLARGRAVRCLEAVQGRQLVHAARARHAARGWGLPCGGGFAVRIAPVGQRLGKPVPLTVISQAPSAKELAQARLGRGRPGACLPALAPPALRLLQTARLVHVAPPRLALRPRSNNCTARLPRRAGRAALRHRTGTGGAAPAPRLAALGAAHEVSEVEAPDSVHGIGFVHDIGSVHGIGFVHGIGSVNGIEFLPPIKSAHRLSAVPPAGTTAHGQASPGRFACRFACRFVDPF